MSDRRRRIFDRWKEQTYDVLIVGGGITGAGIVRDAAMRGLRCALVEKNDFASGTSSKSGKLVHGGLRYLKHGHLRLVIEACHERWLLSTKIAPHIVRPIRFVVPFYRTSRTPRWLVGLGVALYDVLSLGRSWGHLRLHSRGWLARHEPHLDTSDCVGGLSYSDCACLDFRLVIDTLKSAEDHGADLLNYAELVELAGTSGNFKATVRDVASGESHCLCARTVVNAAGPWADEVQQRFAAQERFGMQLSLGIHLVFSHARLPVRGTLALEVARDGRMIYVVPWDNVVLVGTTDTFYSGDKDHLAATDEARQYLLDTVNRYFPGCALAERDVLADFAGIRPLIGSEQGQREEQVSRDYRLLIGDGIVAVSGGKLTTYRAVARKVVNVLVGQFCPEYATRRCNTLAPISGGDLTVPRGAPARLRGLWDRYGSNALEIERLITVRPDLADPIDPRAPFLWAEVVYALEHEYVEDVEDLVDRRLGGFLLAPDVPLRDRIAAWLRTERRQPSLAQSRGGPGG